MQIILDVSANTIKNDPLYFEKMVKTIKEIDRKDNEIVFKTQLFRNIEPNLSLSFDCFDAMYDICRQYGYQLTASVFDKKMLKFLLIYDIPFVKIACRPYLYFLSTLVPETIPCLISVGRNEPVGVNNFSNIQYLSCVPLYPAQDMDYLYVDIELYRGISDHTTDASLFHKYKNILYRYECHYVLEHSEDNPDAGPFAKTPEELKEIINA